MKEDIAAIAEVCHDVNRAYCQSLGDDSQPTWEDAPEWQRETVTDGVVFHLLNPDMSPEASHENWLKKKEKDGWCHGPFKDPVKKRHPYMVPFARLPEGQQAKDYIFRQLVHSLKHVCLSPMIPGAKSHEGTGAAGPLPIPEGTYPPGAIKVSGLRETTSKKKKPGF